MKKYVILISALLMVLLSCSEKTEISKLNVVTTTSFVTDAVKKIAGDRMEVKGLIEYGKDPHSYVPSPRDIATVEKADLIFVNGFDLEEGLLKILKNVNGSKIISLSAHIDPIVHSDEKDEDHHHEQDPHIWMSPLNVMIWSDSIAESLSYIDGENREYYIKNSKNYKGLLLDLHNSIKRRVATIKEENRILITDHDSLAYYAREYGFVILGTIIPGTSSNSDTSSGALIRLIKLLNRTEIQTLFIGEASGPDMEKLVNSIREELDHPVRIVSLKIGSLDKIGSGSDNYIKYMNYNTDRIISGLVGE